MGHACSIQKTNVVKPIEINAVQSTKNSHFQPRIQMHVTNYNTTKLMQNNRRLENELNDITMKFAETQIQNINREKHYKRQLSNIKKRNARLWNSFVEIKYPEFYHKTHKL